MPETRGPQPLCSPMFELLRLTPSIWERGRGASKRKSIYRQIQSAAFLKIYLSVWMKFHTTCTHMSKKVTCNRNCEMLAGG